MRSVESIFFDFCRGAAAWLVFIAHVQQILINPSWMPFPLTGHTQWGWFIYAQFGSLGVMIFFVLSGYLITYSIGRNISESASGTFDAIKYFKARFNRLFPPLAISLIIVLCIYLILYLLGANRPEFFSTGSELYLAREKITFRWWDWLASWLFLNTMFLNLLSPDLNGPLWSVAQEFWFYVIAGFLVLGFNRKWPIVLAAAVIFLLTRQGDNYFIYGMFVWFSGATAAVLHLKYPEFYQKYQIIILIVAGLVAVLWLSLVYFNGNDYLRAKHQYAFGLFFAILLFVLLNNIKLLESFTKIRIVNIMAGTAKYSYTLYLIHFPLLLTIFIFTNLYTVGNLTAVVFVAVVSALLITWFSRKMAGIFEDRHFFRRFVNLQGSSHI